MVNVEVELYGTLAKYAGKKRVEVRASKLLEALQALDYGEEFKRRLFNNHGKPRRFLNTYVNGRDVRFLDKLETVLHEGDVISLIPAVSGG